MNEPMTDGLETRLSRLERSNRWLKWILAVMFTGQLLGLVFIAQLNRGGGVPVVGKTIEAERLIIRDSTGKARVVLGQDENPDLPEPQYGIFNYSKDGESESGLTNWNLHIYSGRGSAYFSPVDVSIKRYKQNVIELNKKQSEYDKQILRLSEKASQPAATKEDKVALDNFIKQHDNLVASFYLNMTGPYLEIMKRPSDQYDFGAGEAIIGVSPYPSVALRSSSDKTSFSLSALKDAAGLTVRDSQGNKRAGLDVGFLDGAAINLYDKDGKTIRATFGNVTLQTIRTGGVQQRPASSLVLFDRDGKVMWSTPHN